jgi:uncharacterized protein (TIGR02246 family)
MERSNVWTARAPGREAVATTSSREAIVLANQHFIELFHHGDAAAVSRCYTPDGQVLPPQSEPVDGRPGIEAFWQAVMGMGIVSVTLETVELFDHGDSACEIGRYSLAVAGGQSVDHGKYVVVWRLEDGEWKLHRDIWNTSVPPTA